jgi:hypothetical protein
MPHRTPAGLQLSLFELLADESLDVENRQTRLTKPYDVVRACRHFRRPAADYISIRLLGMSRNPLRNARTPRDREGR